MKVNDFYKAFSIVPFEYINIIVGKTVNPKKKFEAFLRNNGIFEHLLRDGIIYLPHWITPLLT